MRVGYAPHYDPSATRDTGRATGLGGGGVCVGKTKPESSFFLFIELALARLPSYLM